MTYDGKHPPPEASGLLQRRAVLLGGGVLASGAAVAALASTLGSSPDPRIVQHANAVTGDVRKKDKKEEKEKPKPSKKAAPVIITTEEWGARKARSTPTVVSHSPRYIVIHHTSTPNVADYSTARAERLAQGIQNAHMNERGWPDTGQHFTISRGGYILEGRHGSLEAAREGEFVIGTHARVANPYSVGIECEGNYNGAMPPRKLLASLVHMCAWLCVQYDIDPQKTIVPHRKFNSTDCCGRTFAASLPELRDEVTKAVSKLLG
jgi:hypothetical protein